MRYLLFVFILFLSFASKAQVTIIVDELPTTTPPEDIVYMAGNMNGWNPGDEAFKLTKDNDGFWKITLEEKPEGTIIQYKFTLGSWETVEKGKNGEEINNRVLTYGNGDTVHVVIYNWLDDHGGGTTAADNVKIVDDSFFIPQLNRSRRVWIYLPPDYETSSHNYPVLYMQDGQNLFDMQTSFAGEWEVDETLNKLFDEGVKVPIVVGIDNGGEHRIDEYTPWVNTQYGGGDGELYIDFLVQTLKPFIDDHYRTLPEQEHTGIMGSSLGGLIAHFGAIRNQNIFGMAGIFSPSYWFSDSVYTFTEESGKQQDIRFYMMCGTNEGETTVTDMISMADLLNNSGFDKKDIKTEVIEGGQHNEKLWREQFRKAYLWLYNPWLNTTVENREMINLDIYPNPVASQVHFPKDINYGSNDSLIITDITGRILVEVNSFKGEPIAVCGLEPGIYLFKIISSKVVYSGQFIKN